LVEPASVYHGDLDHTSILKFIAKRFGKGKYSPAVDARPVGDLTEILTRDAARQDLPMPVGIGQTPENPAIEPTPLAFKDALSRAAYTNPVATAEKYPELLTHFDEFSPPAPKS
jgi:hypothetical protein